MAVDNNACVVHAGCGCVVADYMSVDNEKDGCCVYIFAVFQ